MVTFAGCDKSLPGMLMAAARLNLPSVFLYGGSILPGPPQRPGARHRRACSRPSAPAPPAPSTDDGARRHRAQRLPDRGQLRRHVHRQHHGVGRPRRSACRCPARRRRPPSTAAATTSPTRQRRGRRQPARAGHPAPPDHDQGGVRERHRRRRWRSAARPTPCCTCSPSPTRPGSSSSSTTSTGSAARVPHIADMKPHGKYHMTDLDRVGGVPGGDAASCSTPGCSTATASPSPAGPWPRTSPSIDPPAPDGEVVHPLVRPDPRRRRHRRAHRLAGARRARW